MPMQNRSSHWSITASELPMLFLKDVAVIQGIKGMGNSWISLKTTYAKFRVHFWGVMQDSTTQKMMAHCGTVIKYVRAHKTRKERKSDVWPETSQQWCTEGIEFMDIAMVPLPIVWPVLVIARPVSLPPTLTLIFYHFNYFYNCMSTLLGVGSPIWFADP